MEGETATPMPAPEPLGPMHPRPPIDQVNVIAWLSTPDAHGADAEGEAVERIDTHTSILFLVGTRVYKLKRAVKFDYLDYSTPERRRHCCLEEVRLNRRTAPALYRRVRSVSRASDGSLAWDGRGHAVDSVVEMARFDQETQLDCLAERGALRIALMTPLADAIVHLHEIAEWSFDHGGRDGMAAVIRGNGDGLRTYGRDTLDAAACDRFTTTSFETLDRQTPALDARRAGGFVRHCHGDLHLRNVCVVNGAPTLFDCIEFNPAVGCVDVTYDLAFLLMDLLHRGLKRHANIVLNRYRGTHGGYRGVGSCCPLFLATRAAIRAKTSVTAAALQTQPGTADGLRRDAHQYLALAEELLAPEAPPPRRGGRAVRFGEDDVGPTPGRLGRAGAGRADRA